MVATSSLRQALILASTRNRALENGGRGERVDLVSLLGGREEPQVRFASMCRVLYVVCCVSCVLYTVQRKTKKYANLMLPFRLILSLSYFATNDRKLSSN